MSSNEGCTGGRFCSCVFCWWQGFGVATEEKTRPNSMSIAIIMWRSSSTVPYLIHMVHQLCMPLLYCGGATLQAFSTEGIATGSMNPHVLVEYVDEWIIIMPTSQVTIISKKWYILYKFFCYWLIARCMWKTQSRTRRIVHCRGTKEFSVQIPKYKCATTMQQSP